MVRGRKPKRLEKIRNVIDALHGKEEGLSWSELEAATNLSKSTLKIILDSLLLSGVVTYNRVSKKYRLSPAYDVVSSVADFADYIKQAIIASLNSAKSLGEGLFFYPAGGAILCHHNSRAYNEVRVFMAISSLHGYLQELRFQTALEKLTEEERRRVADLYVALADLGWLIAGGVGDRPPRDGSAYLDFERRVEGVFGDPFDLKNPTIMARNGEFFYIVCLSTATERLGLKKPGEIGGEDIEQISALAREIGLSGVREIWSLHERGRIELGDFRLIIEGFKFEKSVAPSDVEEIISRAFTPENVYLFMRLHFRILEEVMPAVLIVVDPLWLLLPLMKSPDMSNFFKSLNKWLVIRELQETARRKLAEKLKNPA